MARRIRVPKVPRRAFNPDRKASTLLLSHVEQLQKGVLAAIRTEGEAAESVRALTCLLQTLRPHLQPHAHREALAPGVRRKRRFKTAKRPASNRRARKR